MKSKDLLLEFKNEMIEGLSVKDGKGYFLMTIPFLDTENDCIQICVIQNDDGTLTISDDGGIFYQCEMAQLDFEKVRKKIIELIAPYRITINENEIILITSPQFFTYHLRNYVQEMIFLSGLIKSKLLK